MVALSGRGWHLAPCLVALVKECDQRAPGRSTVSDGSIGNLEHSTRSSDHNPENGWVCAVDITDDKAGGCDADALAHLIVARRDERVKYVIWNRTIAKSYASRGVPAWQPQPYTGTNPHVSHTHISIHNTPGARGDLRPWWGEEEDDMPLTDADILKVAKAVTIAQQPQLDALRSRLDQVQGNLASLHRRVLGVETMADPNEQHKADQLVGERFRKLLGDG